MHVTFEVKKRVGARITKCMDLATEHFGREFQRPTVDYNKRGMTAGTADSIMIHISLNSTILMENIEAFIARTVGHEVAHIIDKQYNGNQLRYRRGRMVRDVHGENWKHIMHVFGQESSRCHPFNIENARVKKTGQTKFVWTCGCGAGSVELGAKRHARQVAAARTHFGFYQRGHTSKRCGYYTWTNTLIGGVKMPVQQDPLGYTLPKAAMSPQPTGPIPTFVTPRVSIQGGTKLEQCRILYRENHGVARSMMIKLFIENANCTPAGAATYYAKIKKLVG